jgi:hypothetical protein
MNKIPLANFPFKELPLALATVTAGPYEGRTVDILIQYTDGYCICDTGDGQPMEILHIDQLRLWESVKSVTVHPDGSATIEPIQPQ